MTKNKFPKSVSFNLKNAADLAILKHVKKRNFSGYVKKLILADMQKSGNIPTETEQPLSKFEQLQRKIESAKHVNGNSQDNSDTKSDS